MTEDDIADVVELSALAGQLLFERQYRRLIPRAREGDHEAEEELLMMAPYASRRVPWPDGIFDLRHLQELQVGMVIAPALWESAFLAGDPGMPWAQVVREPFTLKSLGPHERQWCHETRVPCRLPTGEVLYYTGAPGEYVRVLLAGSTEGR